jgi:hypothetical protein
MSIPTRRDEALSDLMDTRLKIHRASSAQSSQHANRFQGGPPEEVRLYNLFLENAIEAEDGTTIGRYLNEG